MRIYANCYSLVRAIVGVTVAIAIYTQAQDQEYLRKKKSPPIVHPELLVLNDEIVEHQWPGSLALVNAPTDLQLAETAQCIRFGVIATGDDRDQLLKSAKFNFELTTSGEKHAFPVESPVAVKQIKPEGGDFVTQVLGAAGIKYPAQSMASLSASQARWCVPNDVKDGTAMIVGTAVLANGKTIRLGSRKLDVKTFESARAKSAFKDMNTFEPWLQEYHRAPDPAQLLPALRIVAADSNARSAYNLMYFFIAALKESPAAQEDVARHLPSESVATQMYSVPLLKASAYNIEALLNGFKEDDTRMLKSVELPNPFDIVPNRELPNKMDMLWAMFFANGRIEPVKTIASMLAWRDDYDKFLKMRESGEQPKELTDSIMRGVVYTAAGWSLSAISRNNGVVADYVDALKESPDTPDAVKRELTGLYTNPAFRKN